MRRISSLAAFVLLAFAVAMAATNSTRVELRDATDVAGNKLAPGEYKVSWTGSGDNVSVVFKGNKQEVTVPAKIAEAPARVRTAYLLNGSGSMLELMPGGKKMRIVFNSDRATPSGTQ